MKKTYDPEIGNVQAKIARMLKVDDLVLNPNCEDIAKILAKETSSDWRKEFGMTTLKTFQRVATGLEDAKFGEDDMLQEALAEAMEKKEIRIMVVDKLTSGSWHEVIMKDGAIYLQVSFGASTHQSNLDLTKSVQFARSYWGTDLTSRMSDLIEML